VREWQFQQADGCGMTNSVKETATFIFEDYNFVRPALSV
jgi:hypothetical protein